MNVKQAMKILAKDRWVAFATAGEEGRPRVRMMTVKYHDGMLWCFTSASSAKADQLRRDNRFELTANLIAEGGSGSVRALGSVDIVDDMKTKRELSDSFEAFRDHWRSHEDPDFMLLRLNVESVEIETGPHAKAQRFDVRKK